MPKQGLKNQTQGRLGHPLVESNQLSRALGSIYFEEHEKAA